MPNSNTSPDPDGDLPPPGTRWGAGAGSVLPYLTQSLQAKPQDAREAKQRELPQLPSRERPTASAS